ncbi:hypothetical protein OAX78_02550 [Planctomycetota bacterium]|nr:hypothetical protein [Planctomycetota bacterium]
MRERIRWGRLSVARNELRAVVTLHYPLAFAERPLARQKAQIAEELNTLVTALAKRLRRKRADFDCSSLADDLNAILVGWL